MTLEEWSASYNANINLKFLYVCLFGSKIENKLCQHNFVLSSLLTQTLSYSTVRHNTVSRSHYKVLYYCCWQFCGSAFASTEVLRSASSQANL